MSSAPEKIYLVRQDFSRPMWVETVAENEVLHGSYVRLDHYERIQQERDAWKDKYFGLVELINRG